MGRIMRFNPNIDTGTIVQIVVIAGSMFLGYSQLEKNNALRAAETAQLKAEAQSDRERTDKSLTDIKADIREIAKSVNDVKTDVAVLRGRAAADTGKK